MEDMAIAVYEVIENLNINKINILGHSMGGYVALVFAEKVWGFAGIYYFVFFFYVS